MRALLLALAAAIAPATADGPVAIAVELPAGPLPFGRPCPLRVTLRWDAALVPAPFDETPLRPWVPAPAVIERRRSGDLLVETRHYVAWPFDFTPLQLPALSFTALAPDGHGERTATSEPVERAIVGELDPAAPGAIEWPAAVAPLAELPPERAWWSRGGNLLSIFSIGLALLLLLEQRRRTRRAIAGQGRDRRPAPVTPRATLLARLSEPPAPVTAGAARAAGAELADLLRELLADERALPAPRRSTEEVAELLARAAERPEARAALLDLLRRGDAAKFAPAAPTAAELERQRAATAELLRALALAEASP